VVGGFVVVPVEGFEVVGLVVPPPLMATEYEEVESVADPMNGSVPAWT